MIDTEALRKKVIDLAIQGKLTEQLPSDGDAETLYAKIQEEKNAILDMRGGRKDKSIKEDDEEKPFEIPDNWKWIRFGEVGLFKKGPFGSALTKSMFVPESDKAVKVYEQQHAIKKDASLGTYYITREYFESNMTGFEVKGGDILVSCAGTIGETYIMPEEIEQGIINQALMRVTLVDSIVDEFFLYYFDSNLKTSARNESNGMAIKNIPPFDVMKNWFFPLPPIDEQKRIVDKINKVLTLVDIIDDLQAKYSNDLAVLKSKIIDAGIQGKLTEQLPEDGNAEDLYAQILNQKSRLIKDGKIKKEKPLPDIAADEIPFEIPKNWKWVRWGDLSEKIQYGYNAPAKQSGRIKMVRISDIQDGRVQWETVPFCDIDEEDIDAYLLRENDILFARTGGTVGKSYIVSEIPEEAVYAGYLIRTSYSSDIYAPYMKYFMDSALYWRQLQSGTIATAQPNCNGKTLSKMIVPFPPYAEQKRIAEKIDAILEQINS